MRKLTEVLYSVRCEGSWLCLYWQSPLTCTFGEPGLKEQKIKDFILMRLRGYF